MTHAPKLLAAAGAFALIFGSAHAQEAQRAEDARTETPAGPATGFSAPVLHESALDGLAGGQTTTTTITNTSRAISEQRLTGQSSGNSQIAGQSIGSGALSLESNAFSGFSGLGAMIMNTGHNNSLQTSISVSIVVTPAAQ